MAASSSPTKDTTLVAATADVDAPSPSSDISPVHSAPKTALIHSQQPAHPEISEPDVPLPQQRDDGPAKQGRFRYLTTKDFWLVLLLGQILALCVTGTNTLTTLLVLEGTSIPAFQTFFNYVLLNLIYTSYTWYRYGMKRWARLLVKDGWKYIILSFLDVQGNYFTVLAYRYTTILSAQLINFWAIVVVVTVSFTLLRVRYHWAQVLGIVICIGGMGLLLASDHLTSSSSATSDPVSSGNQLKGDLFALAGATFYGLSNVAEEYLVSHRPLYEVVGQIGWWGTIINGAQAAIFDRASFRTATWNANVAGYLTGYTLILSLFYSLVPILYRLASAAFFNISLLTGNFWGAIIGIRVFGYTVHFLYPIAFVLIMVGHFVYFLGKGVLGEAKKAWLGEGQEQGVVGVGTAKKRILRGDDGGWRRRRKGMHGLWGRGGVERESAGVV